MRQAFSILFFLLVKLAPAQERDAAFVMPSLAGEKGSLIQKPPAVFIAASKSVGNPVDLTALLAEGRAGKKFLGFSQNGLPIELYYFPGASSNNALVIGGVHGSELSAIEVARELINQLQNGEKPFYNVIVVPMLFPDNALAADTCGHDRDETNTGRYTSETSIDPNRQMPKLGKAFNSGFRWDAYGRQMENENALLLQLIEAFKPGRIVNLHAIKDYLKAGVYADPRTDCRGYALGFESDSTLALLMANSIAKGGGNVPGNNLKKTPSALYYLDPVPVAAGQWQPRNLHGSSMMGKIRGVSLGGWASTAVCDGAARFYRPAIRVITMEFPGYKKPVEYLSAIDHDWFAQQTVLYAGAIKDYFLQNYFVEEKAGEEKLALSQ